MTAPADLPAHAPTDASASTPIFLTDPEERARAENELAAAGRPLPLHALAAWAVAFPEVPSAIAALRARNGRYLAAVGVALNASRALPGHQIWRVDRVTDVLDPRDAARLVEAVVAEARRRMRVLRLELSVTSRSDAFRSAIAAQLARAQFEKIPARRTYDYTLVLNLDGEEEMLARLSRQTRRNIRATERQPVTVRPIVDPALAPRMTELMRETLARTGGTYQPVDWSGAMRLSSAVPDRSRLVGMFRTDADGPEALLAFSWGMHHGDHAVYDAGASTRATDVRIAMAYPLIWDLVVWARRGGAKWFDFGGVSRPEPGAEDPLAGISDFKRSFSRQVEEVGDEYVIELAPIRSAVARALGSGARAVRELTTR